MRCPHCGAENTDDARFCGACGRATSSTEPSFKDLAPASAPAPDLVGRDIAGRYRVLAKLGEGGMGAVYRGEQISLKRKVAIKVLKPELSRDPGLVRRFNAEAELAARLSHPNTVNIYDFGQDADGALFIAMEFLEGRSLRQVMTQEGPLPPWRALAIARQIAASLADAHGHGIVHRDLKPDNVMLTERGRDRDVVRVLDFGIAKLRDDNRQTVNAMTRAGDLVGTPQYMAPEQIKGEHVDGRTDVYALGAMLYEMVTGRLPFEGPTVMAILSKHLLDAAEPPTVRRPDLQLPPALDQLIMAAMAKEPGQRPPSMEHVGEHLAAIAATLAPPSSAQVQAAQATSPWSAQQPVVAPSQVGGPPGPPPVGPAPAGPPPGVPRSYPPGALEPRPPTAPVAHLAAVGPAPTPQATAARRGSRAPLYAVLAVLLLGGAGAGIYVATRSSKPDQAGEGSGGAAADPNDPWAARATDPGTPPSPPEQPDDPPDDPPPAPSSWGSYRNPDLGWSLKLPPGVATSPTEANGSLNFSGSQGGESVSVGALAVPNDGSEATTAQLEGFASNIAGALGATITESGFVTTQGKKRYRIVMEVAGERAEARFFIEPRIVVMAYYSHGGDWDAHAAERREFFEGVGLP